MLFFHLKTTVLPKNGKTSWKNNCSAVSELEVLGGMYLRIGVPATYVSR